jgi:hypothetical protein
VITHATPAKAQEENFSFQPTTTKKNREQKPILEKESLKRFPVPVPQSVV